MRMKTTIRKVIAVALLMAVVAVMCAFTIPDGITVDGYDESVDYMARMQKCAQEGTENSMIMGAIYELQRNLKIESVGMQYGKTDFFQTSNSVQDVRGKLDSYQNSSANQNTKWQAEQSQITYYFTESDVVMCAKVLYNECRGIPSKVEKACVVWTILNRVDSTGYDFRNTNTISSVILAPYQFAYSAGTPVTQELYDLAYDVLTRWNLEKNGYTDVGRVLPSNYLYYGGNGVHNFFRTTYQVTGNYWNYSLPSPY